RAKAPRCGPRSVESAMEYSDTRAWDRSRSRRDTPALPFCQFTLNAQKPKESAYPTEIKTLGDRLRARRLDLGLYQKDVAAIIGVTADTICYWENGRVQPSKMLQPRIADFINEDW